MRAVGPATFSLLLPPIVKPQVTPLNARMPSSMRGKTSRWRTPASLCASGMSIPLLLTRPHRRTRCGSAARGTSPRAWSSCSTSSRRLSIREVADRAAKATSARAEASRSAKVLDLTPGSIPTTTERCALVAHSTRSALWRSAGVTARERCESRVTRSTDCSLWRLMEQAGCPSTTARPALTALTGRSGFGHLAAKRAARKGDRQTLASQMNSTRPTSVSSGNISACPMTMPRPAKTWCRTNGQSRALAVGACTPLDARWSSHR